MHTTLVSIGTFGRFQLVKELHYNSFVSSVQVQEVSTMVICATIDSSVQEAILGGAPKGPIVRQSSIVQRLRTIFPAVVG